MTQTELVKKIHQSSTKVVLAIAGGGSEAIGELLRHGGGSQTLLEAVVPYSQQSFGSTVPHPWDSILGIGLTCSLAKENERQGRRHQIWLATQSVDQTITTNVELAPGRSREEEESLVAALVINAYAYGCGVCESLPINLDPPTVVSVYKGSQEATKLLLGLSDCVSLPSGTGRVNRLVFPGSFNPIHEAHLEISRLAAQFWPDAWRNGQERKTDFEISVVNVEKPPLSFKAINQRSDFFNEQKFNNPDVLGSLFFTRAATFREKALLFPQATFVVGMDTANRIVNGQYDNDLTTTERVFREQGIKWLIFPRNDVERPSHFNTLGTYLVMDFDTTKFNHSSRGIRNVS